MPAATVDVRQPAARGRRRPSRRPDLVRAAAELFSERGYGATTVDDVGARAGVSGPAVYWHFPSKEALLAAMLTDISDRLLEGGRRCVSDARDAADALAGLVRWQVRFALEHPERITVHARELVHLAPAAHQRVRRTQRRYVELWVDTLGVLGPGMPETHRRTAAHAAIGLINSTPYLGDGLSDEEMERLLTSMALAALARAVDLTPDPDGDFTPDPAGDEGGDR